MKLRNTRFIFLIFEFQTNSKSTCSCLQYLLYQCLPTVQILSYYRLDTFANFNPTPASPRANLEPNAISRYCNTAIREVQQVFPLISSHATAPPLLTMCEVGHATTGSSEEGWEWNRGWLETGVERGENAWGGRKTAVMPVWLDEGERNYESLLTRCAMRQGRKRDVRVVFRLRMHLITRKRRWFFSKFFLSVFYVRFFLLLVIIRFLEV